MADGKSDSQNSRSLARTVTSAPVPWAWFSRPRSSTRRILPEIVFGSSANSSRRIRLYGARCARA